LSLTMFACYFTFWVSLKQDARIAVPSASLVGVLAFSNTLLNLLPPVQYVTRTSLFLILAIIYILLVFFAQVFVRYTFATCEDVEKKTGVAEKLKEKLEKEAKEGAKDKKDKDGGEKKDKDGGEKKDKDGGEKKDKDEEKKDDDDKGKGKEHEKEPEKEKEEPKKKPVPLDDPMAKVKVDWAWFIIVTPKNYELYMQKLERINFFLRIVYLTIFLVFLIPVFLAPSTIPDLPGAPASQTTEPFAIWVWVIIFLIFFVGVVVAIITWIVGRLGVVHQEDTNVEMKFTAEGIVSPSPVK